MTAKKFKKFWAVPVIVMGVLVVYLIQQGMKPATPPCLNTLSQVEPPFETPLIISTYMHKGRMIYHSEPDCCDQYTKVYDDLCAYVCAPGGGITGKGDGQCPSFYTDATDKKVIWTNPRNNRTAE